MMKLLAKTPSTKRSLFIFLLLLQVSFSTSLSAAAFDWKNESQRIVFAVKKAKSWLNSNYSKSASLNNKASALIAFTMIDDTDHAWKIIKEIQKTPRSNQVVLRNGESAWMVYALTYFLKINLKKDPKFLQKAEIKPVLSYIRKTVDLILKYRYKIKGYRLSGYISDGWGSNHLKVSEKGKIEETYEGARVSSISAKDTVKLYFMFKELHLLNLKEFKDLKEPYEFYKDHILKDFWNEKTSQFNWGWKKSAKDESLSLNSALWGSFFLKSIGEKKLAKESLKTIKKYENWRSRPRGHIPFLNQRVYEDSKVNAFFYPKKSMTMWRQIDFSWWEGTLQVLLASRLMNGKHPGIDKKLLDYLSLQKKDGSFPPASRDIPYQYSTKNSLGSTAWFIITASCYMVPEFSENFLN